MVDPAILLTSLAAKDYHGKFVAVKGSQIGRSYTLKKGRALKKTSEEIDFAFHKLSETPFNKPIDYNIIKANIESINQKINIHNTKVRKSKSFFRKIFLFNEEIKEIKLPESPEFQDEIQQALLSSGADHYKASNPKFEKLFNQLPADLKNNQVKIIEIESEEEKFEALELMKEGLAEGKVRICFFLKKDSPVYEVDNLHILYREHGDDKVQIMTGALTPANLVIRKEDMSFYFGQNVKAVEDVFTDQFPAQTFDIETFSPEIKISDDEPTSLVKNDKGPASEYEPSHEFYGYDFKKYPFYLRTDSHVHVLELSLDDDYLKDERGISKLKEEIQDQLYPEAGQIRFYMPLFLSSGMPRNLWIYACTKEGERIYVKAKCTDDGDIRIPMANGTKNVQILLGEFKTYKNLSQVRKALESLLI